jgi:hypothetical protein
LAALTPPSSLSRPLSFPLVGEGAALVPK